MYCPVCGRWKPNDTDKCPHCEFSPGSGESNVDLRSQIIKTPSENRPAPKTPNPSQSISGFDPGSGKINIVINNNNNTSAPAEEWVDNRPVSPKSRGTFIVLAVFLGIFGIHRFYAGYVGIGFIYLILLLITIGIGAPLLWIAAIVDCILITEDSQGRRLD